MFTSKPLGYSEIFLFFWSVSLEMFVGSNLVIVGDTGTSSNDATGRELDKVSDTF